MSAIVCFNEHVIGYDVAWPSWRRMVAERLQVLDTETLAGGRSNFFAGLQLRPRLIPLLELRESS